MVERLLIFNYYLCIPSTGTVLTQPSLPIATVISCRFWKKNSQVVWIFELLKALFLSIKHFKENSSLLVTISLQRLVVPILRILLKEPSQVTNTYPGKMIILHL